MSMGTYPALSSMTASVTRKPFVLLFKSNLGTLGWILSHQSQKTISTLINDTRDVVEDAVS